jgi:predicted transcriptional regulator
MMSPALPTDAELEILRVLWEHEPCAVRDVHEAFGKIGRSVAYTTVLKLLQIMTEKGLVDRDVSGRAHLYRSAIPRPHTQKQLVDDLVERAFGGDAAQLVLHALSAASPRRRNSRRFADCWKRWNATPQRRPEKPTVDCV